MLVKNVLNPSVISSALYSLLLSINTSGNLLMCDCFLQIISLCDFHVSTLLFLCLLIKSEKYCCLLLFNINVNLFLYYLYFNSSWRVLLFRNAIYSSVFFLQLFLNPVVIHGSLKKFPLDFITMIGQHLLNKLSII